MTLPVCRNQVGNQKIEQNVGRWMEGIIRGMCKTMHELIDETELQAELKAIEGESIGWHPLGQGAYLHLGAGEEMQTIVHVMGIPDLQMAPLNVLLLI